MLQIVNVVEVPIAAKDYFSQLMEDFATNSLTQRTLPMWLVGIVIIIGLNLSSKSHQKVKENYRYKLQCQAKKVKKIIDKMRKKVEDVKEECEQRLESKNKELIDLESQFEKKIGDMQEKQLEENLKITRNAFMSENKIKKRNDIIEALKEKVRLQNQQIQSQKSEIIKKKEEIEIITEASSALSETITEENKLPKAQVQSLTVTENNLKEEIIRLTNKKTIFSTDLQSTRKKLSSLELLFENIKKSLFSVKEKIFQVKENTTLKTEDNKITKANELLKTEVQSLTTTRDDLMLEITRLAKDQERRCDSYPKYEFNMEEKSPVNETFLADNKMTEMKTTTDTDIHHQPIPSLLSLKVTPPSLLTLKVTPPIYTLEPGLEVKGRWCDSYPKYESNMEEKCQVNEILLAGNNKLTDIN